jgi:hypothetical protein
MRINPMMLAQTRLLVPKTLPSSLEADISTAKEVNPEKKTVIYNILRINTP